MNETNLSVQTRNANENSIRVQDPQTATNPLAAIARRVQSFDKLAEAELYSTLLRGVSFWLRHSPGTEDKLEITHDAFIVCVEAIRQNKILDLERIPGFIVTVVRRMIQKRRRKTTRAAQMFTEFADGLPTPAKADGRLDGSHEAIDEIKSALTQMRPMDREVIERFYFLQHTQEEICRALGLTQDQFRLGKWRAKTRLLSAIQKRARSRNLQALVGRFNSID